MRDHITQYPHYTTEEWRPVVGWEHLYEVSSYGRVRSLPRRVVSHLANSRRGYYQRKGGILRSAPDGRGHLLVVLCDDAMRRTLPVHVLVANAFLGPRPDGYETHHINEDKQDNRIENLVYLERKAHRRHHRVGARCATAKLTETQARAIWHMARQGKVSQGTIARIFGVSQGTVSNIKMGRSWRHLGDEDA